MVPLGEEENSKTERAFVQEVIRGKKKGGRKKDTATLGNGDVQTDRTGSSPGEREKKKKKKTGSKGN